LFFDNRWNSLSLLRNILLLSKNGCSITNNFLVPHLGCSFRMLITCCKINPSLDCCSSCKRCCYKKPALNTQTAGKAIADYKIGLPVSFVGLLGTRLFSDRNVQLPFCNIDHSIQCIGPHFLPC